MLIWFAKEPGSDTLRHMCVPIICGSTFVDKALRIENSPGFYAWGVNPWTGEKADIEWEPPWF